MTRTIFANPDMLAAQRQREADKAALDVQREIEREEGAATRAHVRTQIARSQAANEDIEESPTGRVSILDRDGLLWLVKKRRLNDAQRSAAEQYRRDYAVVHLSGFQSNVGERQSCSSPNIIEMKVGAIRLLDEARNKGLNRDAALISLMDAVAGRGETLRDLAKGDRAHAEMLEVEFRVACRMLSRFYGMAS